MAKGEQRGNREVKKPKQNKTKPATPASPFAPQTGNRADPPPRSPGAKR